jgi:hypothetical protein
MPVLAITMSDDLLIFVGYSQDAKDEAAAIRDLKNPLQRR